MLKTKGKKENMLLTSQACILPIQKGFNTEFNIDAFSINGTARDPAGMTILATKVIFKNHFSQTGSSA